ncbi:hypothetical protein R3P38DRAFT_3195011 [Favolaschia claudopus]|uniref:Uncharacterized protein n=1 Tax=Favolaschia claudopus TaxID=2862362 RepID=A0AAW0BCS9_9AGAR
MKPATAPPFRTFASRSTISPPSRHSHSKFTTLPVKLPPLPRPSFDTEVHQPIINSYFLALAVLHENNLEVPSASPPLDDEQHQDNCGGRLRRTTAAEYAYDLFPNFRAIESGVVGALYRGHAATDIAIAFLASVDADNVVSVLQIIAPRRRRSLRRRQRRVARDVAPFPSLLAFHSSCKIFFKSHQKLTGTLQLSSVHANTPSSTLFLSSTAFKQMEVVGLKGSFINIAWLRPAVAVRNSNVLTHLPQPVSDLTGLKTHPHLDPLALSRNPSTTPHVTL